MSGFHWRMLKREDALAFRTSVLCGWFIEMLNKQEVVTLEPQQRERTTEALHLS